MDASSPSPSRLAVCGTAGYIELLERPTVISRRHAVSLAHRLVRECRCWSAASPLITEGISLELLAEMAHTSERLHRRPPRWLAIAKDLLDQHYAESIHIAEIALAVQVHPVHLIRTFREFFHATPGEYVRRLRLDLAASLLTAGNLPLTQVAMQCGFADQSHFSKAFRRQFSQSPGEYRRLLGQKMFRFNQNVQSGQEFPSGS